MTTVVDKIEPPSAQMRDALNQGPTTSDAFREAFTAMPSLDQIELVSPPPRELPPLDSARVVFWNAERLKYPDASAKMLAATGADVFLLCELDLGMARSGNRHTAAELAAALDGGYIFAVEFVELDLGDARERSWHKGETNTVGLHGAGLVSPRPLVHPRLVRLETSGRWFDGKFGERRVGGRIAVTAEFAVAGRPVLLVSVHFESHTGPADRLAETRHLLNKIDRDAARLPVLIGGDFNTNTMERVEHESHAAIAEAVAAEPERLLSPMRHEPMFAELAGRGYDWQSCNVMGARTQRTRPDGTPAEPLGRIDWFFARGLDCSEPAVIPAVDDKGVAISDHEALAVTVSPSRV